MQPVVGVDSLNVWASSLAVDLREVAKARGTSDKSFAQTRFSARSLLPPWEDAVTMAVNAARPVVRDVGAERFGLLIVATESGLDFGKPLSTWVHRHVGLGANCRNFELKHACFGGSAALLSAASYVRERPDRAALVVMTDIARNHLGDPAELTAGCAAVAIAVTANPRILALDAITGSATREVWDVARPTPTSEHNDAVLSLYSYLDLVEIAWADYQSRAKCGAPHSHFSHLLFHTPLYSLAERAHAALLEAADPDVEETQVRASFEAQVLPSLVWNALTANTYSGSLYVSLAGLLATREVPLNARLGLFSYGSGACAEFFSGTVQSGARARIASMDIEGSLRARRALSVPEYEASIREHERSFSMPDFSPDTAAHGSLFQDAYSGTGRLVLESVVSHERTYRDA